MNWLQRCAHWKAKWPACPGGDSANSVGIGLYHFMDELSKRLGAEDTVVVDAGSSMYVAGQALRLRRSNRLVVCGAQLDMGFALPASIGVAMAKTSGRTIVVVGDGSLHTNIQELAVIREHQLPIKLFVWNNNGYLSIRNTQKNYYGGRLIGCDAQHGVWLPAFADIAHTYQLVYYRLTDIATEGALFQQALDEIRPSLIEVMCVQDQQILPTSAPKDGKQVPLSQMYPFLSDEELQEEMQQ